MRSTRIATWAETETVFMLDHEANFEPDNLIPGSLGNGSPPNDLAESPSDNYWQASRQPLASLLFILPFLLIYEIGVLFRPPTANRNGAEVWLRDGLAGIGLGQYYWLLPLLVVVILLAWQHLTGRPWKVAPGVLSGMFLESCLYALALLTIARLHRYWFPSFLLQLRVAADALPPFYASWIGDALTSFVDFVGAGVYEELLFRLILLPLTAWLLRQVGLTAEPSWWWAILLTSLIFSAAHHVGAAGEPWAVWPFVFRAVAGAFFSILFLYRGFGIAAGSHAIYDILVGLILKA
jgi:membrane protease YdiL (CAAX protease family)